MRELRDWYLLNNDWCLVDFELLKLRSRFILGGHGSVFLKCLRSVCCGNLPGECGIVVLHQLRFRYLFYHGGRGSLLELRFLRVGKVCSERSRVLHCLRRGYVFCFCWGFELLELPCWHVQRSERSKCTRIVRCRDLSSGYRSIIL